MRIVSTICFVASAALATSGAADPIRVFTPGDEGRPFVDVHASGLYAATCIANDGCTCAAAPIDRAELAVVLGRDAVSADVMGIWTSPATDLELTDETPDALHARFGGSGHCPQTALEPLDGAWRDGRPFDIAVQCGQASAMFRQVLAEQDIVTARIAWNGVFSGDTIQAAFMAADPDPEYTEHVFADVTPVESVGTLSMQAEGGTMTSTGRMRLLSPGLFSMHWDFRGRTEEGPCNWSTAVLVTWVGE